MRRPLLLALLASLTVAGPAHGAGWRPIDDLLPAGSAADYPAQALAPGGHAAIVWQTVGPARVAGTARRAGEPLAPAVPIAAADPESFQPQVAIDAAGNVVVAYEAGAAAGRRVYVSFRPTGGSFSAPVPVSAAGGVPFGTALAMNAAGEAVVAWIETDGEDTVEAAIRPVGGSFGAVQTIAVTGSRPQVGIDDSGQALVAHLDQSTPPRVAVARRAAGATAFGPSTPVSPAGEESLNPTLAMNGAGHAIVGWTHNNAGTQSMRVAIARPGSDFVPQVPLGTASTTSGPVLALDGAGNALAGWAADVGPDQLVVTARIPVDGAPGAPEPQSDPGADAGNPLVAMNASGRAAIGWRRSDGAFRRLQVSLGTFSGTFSAPESISAAGINTDIPALGMDADGSVLATWLRYAGAEYIPQVRVYDAGPPQLRSVAMPVAGVAGQPSAFSASAFDVWSPTSLAWTFGDGTTSPDGASSHTYAEPGTYDVAVTATDAAGNTSTDARKISIAAAPIALPVLSGLRLSRKRFRPAKSGGSVAAVKRRTTVTYSLNAAARVIFRVQRRSSGRRVGGKCVRVTPGNRTRKTCTRFVARKGSFGVDSLAGPNRFRFTGRLRSRKLRPGRHRLVARPQNGAGRGAVAHAAFRIVR
jgi:hypothetical protein